MSETPVELARVVLRPDVELVARLHGANLVFSIDCDSGNVEIDLGEAELLLAMASDRGLVR